MQTSNTTIILVQIMSYKVSVITYFQPIPLDSNLILNVNFYNHGSLLNNILILTSSSSVGLSL